VTKPVLVGESNPYGDDPEMALFPLPRGCSGWRLCHTVLGMTKRDYLDRFERANLVFGNWSPSSAKFRAALLRAPKMVLLGSKVSMAFGLEYIPMGRATLGLTPLCQALMIPHPSGRCRAWNDPEVILQVRQAVAGFLPNLSPLFGQDYGN
jgi:hypothetical protein